MAVEIVTYVNSPSDLSLKDIYAHFNAIALSPGAKVTVVEVFHDGKWSEVVVAYYGVGSKVAIARALLEKMEE